MRCIAASVSYCNWFVFHPFDFINSAFLLSKKWLLFLLITLMLMFLVIITSKCSVSIRDSISDSISLPIRRTQRSLACCILRSQLIHSSNWGKYIYTYTLRISWCNTHTNMEEWEKNKCLLMNGACSLHKQGRWHEKSGQVRVNEHRTKPNGKTFEAKCEWVWVFVSVCVCVCFILQLRTCINIIRILLTKAAAKSSANGNILCVWILWIHASRSTPTFHILTRIIQPRTHTHRIGIWFAYISFDLNRLGWLVSFDTCTMAQCTVYTPPTQNPKTMND